MRVRVPPPASVEPLLTIAADLEERDARVAAALARVEAEQAEVDALRIRASAAGELLAWLPQARSENAYALHHAAHVRDVAAAAVRDADDEAKPAAEAALAAADLHCARLQEHERAFARQEEEARAEVECLALSVGADGLDGTVETLSQRRGVLLVERSNLARERDAVVREATELLAAALVDPSAATSVAGLRARLERALT